MLSYSPTRAFKRTASISLLFAAALVANACAVDAPVTDDDDGGTSSSNSGGNGTGGNSAGGNSTGGNSTGGNSTGGNSTGGNSAGGMGGSDGGMGGSDGGMGGSAGGMGGMGGMGGAVGGMGGMGGMSPVGCNIAADCNANEICDVTTQDCAPSQCNPALAQPGGCVGVDPVCIEQASASGFGACYEGCDPFDVACPGGLECRNNTYGQFFGVCQNAGTATLGQPCNPDGNTPNGWTINTGCATGLACLEDAAMMPVCFQTCDFFDFGAASCPGTDVCHLFGICLPRDNSGFDDIPLEGACVGATGGENCGLSGDGYTGACNDLNDGEGMVCHAFCTTGPSLACANGTYNTCYDVFNMPLAGDVGACGP